MRILLRSETAGFGSKGLARRNRKGYLGILLHWRCKLLELQEPPSKTIRDEEKAPKGKQYPAAVVLAIGISIPRQEDSFERAAFLIIRQRFQERPQTRAPKPFQHGFCFRQHMVMCGLPEIDRRRVYRQ